MRPLPRPLLLLLTSTRTGTSNHAYQDMMIVMTLLFSIICLESFSPLILWGIVSLLFYRNICWETTLSILVVTWLRGALVYGGCSTVSFMGGVNAFLQWVPCLVSSKVEEEKPTEVIDMQNKIVIGIIIFLFYSFNFQQLKRRAWRFGFDSLK